MREKLLKIAKRILEVNPNACLTGTLMLSLRGVDLGREPHDIDILFADYGPNLIIPKEYSFIDKGFASDGTSQKYEYDGILIDVLSSNEIPEDVNGIRLGSVAELMDAKYSYCKQNNEEAKKHYADLIILGFDFEKRKIDEEKKFNDLLNDLIF